MFCDNSRRVLKILNFVLIISNKLFQLYRVETLLIYQQLQTIIDNSKESKYYILFLTNNYRSLLDFLKDFVFFSYLLVTKIVSFLTILSSNASIDARFQSIYFQNSIFLF